jgi:hypothetical protein
MLACEVSSHNDILIALSVSAAFEELGFQVIAPNVGCHQRCHGSCVGILITSNCYGERN